MTKKEHICSNIDCDNIATLRIEYDPYCCDNTDCWWELTQGYVNIVTEDDEEWNEFDD